MQPAVSVSVDGAHLLQVYDDGRLEWSEDQINGAPPLHHARIDPARMARVISEIRTSELVGGSWTGEVHTGPDARKTSVVVRGGDGVIVDVASWHELFEADPRLVVTSTGVQPLGERTREAVLAQEPADYRRFRRRWDFVLGRLRSLIPGRGQ